MTRPIVVGVAALTLLVPSHAAAKPTKRKVTTTPVSIEITSDACPKLASGTTITGSGTSTTVTWTTTKRGRRTVASSTVASGSATDQAGGAYAFVFSKQFRVANARSRPRRYRGTMVELFKLDGPAALMSGFVARYRTNLADVQDLRLIDIFGDPIDPFGAPGCNPL